MKQYKSLFFDLDNTIWDFDRNSAETLLEIFEKFQLHVFFQNSDLFILEYRKKNDLLWNLYRLHKIKREELNINRFYHLLKKYGKDDVELASQLATSYLDICKTKNYLVPDAFEVLTELQSRYSLYIITNGFVEYQERKLIGTGIKSFFKKIYYSEYVGAHKPEKAFFEYAIKSSNAKKKESLVIGDHFEVDIVGAKSFGIDQVYYNPTKKEGNLFNPTYEIVHLKELLNFL